MPNGRPNGASPEVRFRPLTIELEVADHSVAAYQVELKIVSGDTMIVGVEGGSAIGFTEPPYYDSAALSGGRIILAALNPFVSLPTGRHKVAVIHMRESGETPIYELEVITAGDLDGNIVPVTAVLLIDAMQPVAEGY
ncbi:MAG: hypothetical protein DRJ65_12155 [Acidobacteria bacterium]|nr:MAG: hypothetical protein DRJ65_12155 [Acidobacteriota bacterium]